jgi:dihydropteroate synthase
VAEVAGFLGERVAAAEAAGIACDRIAVDPGFGFGKTLEHNLAAASPRGAGGAGLAAAGRPVAQVHARPAYRACGDRTGSMPVSRRHVLAVERGARIVRVHDVAATRDALAVVQAVEDY